jgi:zinc protease
MKTKASELVSRVGLYVALSVAAAACIQPAFSQTKVTSVEGITEYRLDNGMRVLLFPDASKPTVTVNVTYLVGSRHEGYGEAGMAHLLEHMLFRGTEKNPDVKTAIRNHGGDFNGTTSNDRTNYFETMPATDENLRWTLEMEADRMVNSRVSRQDLDAEMTVVRNEFERGENSPGRVLEERVIASAYLWHNYGRTTIGSRSDIENVPIERLQAFYKNYYQPDNAVLIVAGKFDEAKTLGWIKETFGAIPKPSRRLIPTYTEEPTQDGEREVTLRRVGDNQILMVAYHVPSGGDPDAVPLNVLGSILDDAPAGRLYKALVETKKAISVRVENNQLHDPGYLLITAEVRKEGSLDDVRQTTLRVIEELVKEPPSKEEVDRVRTSHLKDFELMFNNSQRVSRIMSEWASMGDWRLMFLDRDRTEKVTPQDVARVAKDYLKPSNRTIGQFIPTDAPPDRAVIKPAPDLSAMLNNYTGRAAVEQGEAFDPSPANIDARTQRVTLANGMKLILLPKKTRGGAVSAVISLHYGDEKSVFGKGTAAQFAGAMLMRGTQKHTRQQLQDELDKLKVQMGANATATDANVNITTVRASMAAALRLAAEVLKQPSFPEAEFEQLRQALLGRTESTLREPQALAPQAMRTHFNRYPAGDPRHASTMEEDIENYKKVTLDEAKRFYTDFLGASDAELAVVGDFDPAEIQKIAEEEFGSWKSPKPYHLVLRARDRVETVNHMIETPDKANAVFAGGFTLEMNEDDPDYPALMLANDMFGGDLKSRLFARIREKEGLSYGVRSGFNASVRSKFAQFAVQAICAPENILKVEAAFKDEVAKLLKDGFTDAEVAAAKQTYLDDRTLGRSQDAGLARILARNAQFGWTMAREAEMDRKVLALTTAQINETVRKYFDPASISYFKAGDFKKAGITQSIK